MYAIDDESFRKPSDKATFPKFEERISVQTDNLVALRKLKKGRDPWKDRTRETVGF